MSNLKILKLQNSGYDSGLIHGKYFNEEIKWLIKSFREVFSVILRRDVSVDIIKNKALEFNSKIPKRYCDEMQGIADGARVDYSEILLINTFEDILNLFYCSSIITFKKTEFNTLIHGRNLDYAVRQVVKIPVIFDYKHEFTVVGIPGYIGGVTSTNKYGITISYNYAPCIEQPKIGMPSGLMCRKIIEESKNLCDVRKIIESADKSVCSLITASSVNENTAITFEVSLHSVANRIPENDFLCTANHFISHPMAKESQKMSKDMNSTSTNRQHLLQNYIKNKLYIDLDGIKKALHIVKQGQESFMSTVQSVIFIPEEKKIYFADDTNIPPNASNNYSVYKYGDDE